MIRTMLFLLLLPFLSQAQPEQPVYALNLTVEPAEEVSSSRWMYKTIELLEQRLKDYGMLWQFYEFKAADNKINVKIKATQDPEVVKAILTSTGVFKLLPVHKVDDPQLKTFYHALENAVVTLDGKSEKMSNHFQINDPPHKNLKVDFRRYPPAVIGMAKGENIAIVNQFLNLPKVQAMLPKNASFVWGVKTSNIHVSMYDLYLIDDTPGDYLIGSEYITKVEIITKPNIYGVTKDAMAISFDEVGKQQLRTVTGANLDRELVVLIDDKALSAPLVKGIIEAGVIQIPGSFNRREAAFFGKLFRSKPLPIKLKVTEHSREITKIPYSHLTPVNHEGAKVIWKQNQ